MGDRLHQRRHRPAGDDRQRRQLGDRRAVRLLDQPEDGVSGEGRHRRFRAAGAGRVRAGPSAELRPVRGGHGLSAQADRREQCGQPHHRAGRGDDLQLCGQQVLGVQRKKGKSLACRA